MAGYIIAPEDEMDEMKYAKLAEINGRMEAEIIESYLEAQGIDVELFQESVGHSAFPVAVDGLGCVQIFVPKNKMGEARELLKSYREGINEE
jgi:hypothetical protein